MTMPSRFLAPLFASLVFGLGCSSSSSSATGDGGASQEGGGGGGGGSAAGCAVILDDMTVECTVNRIGGVSNVKSEADCEAMTTYVASCPTANLVGCCTAPANTGGGASVTQEECYYNVDEEGSEECAACDIADASASGQPLFNTAAQQEARCKATGVVQNPGTWSATP